MSVRQILGVVLLLIAPVLLLVAAILIARMGQPSPPAEVHDHLKGTTIAFYVGRTSTTFYGDCVPLRWDVEGGSVGYVYVSGAPSMGSGSLQNCDGTDASLRIVYDDGTSHTWTIPIQRTFDTSIGAVVPWLMLVPSILCAVAGLLLSGVLRRRTLQRPIVQYGLALVFALAFVFVLDLFTNSLNIYRYYWDHTHYLNMAEHGVLRNPDLVAPYAYRPAIPLLAGLVSDVLGRSVLTGFRLITYVGLISQLLLVFFFARQFARKTWVPWVVMLVIAISTYHAKFLLFDIYRPDSLAYSLILIGMWALFRRNRGITDVYSNVDAVGATHGSPLHNNTVIYDLVILATTAFGMLVREFCILPAALLVLHLLRSYRRTRQRHLLVEIIVVGLVIVASYGLPRQLILVGRSDQFLDDQFSNIPNIVTNITRDFNILLGTAVYVLPLLVLLTRERVRRVWQRVAPLHFDLIIYTLIVLGLSMFGGSDIARFTAYFFVPLIIILVALLEDGIHPVEVGYMLLATATFNRVLSPIPMDNLDAYLDFYIVWGDRTSTGTWLRALELLSWIVGAVLLRKQIRKPANPETLPNAQAVPG